jgi:acyl-CoA thioester hydrolase
METTMTEGEMRNDIAFFPVHGEIVRPEWVDYNNHMNVAYYVLVFDHATDAVFDHLDLGEAYREKSGCSVFVGEAHVTYEREVCMGDRLRVTSRVLGFDGKRIILYHEMDCDRAGGLVATNEVLCLHVDLTSRRAAPLPKAAVRRLERAAAWDAGFSRPLRAGRTIGLDTRRP